jgi:hypothetical protein
MITTCTNTATWIKASDRIVTPPFEELGDIRGININRTTTAKSWEQHKKHLLRQAYNNITKRKEPPNKLGAHPSSVK